MNRLEDEDQVTPEERRKARAQSLKSAGSAGVKTASEGGSTTDIAKDAAIASGNPYAMAGGLALGVLGASEKRKEARRNLMYKAQLDKKASQEQAINKLIQVSQGLRRL